MAGKDKSKKHASPNERSGAPDRGERGMEMDSGVPLFSADSIHSTQEAKFAFDSDGPVGGPVADLRSPIDESDEELRQRHGRTEPDEDER